MSAASVKVQCTLLLRETGGHALVCTLRGLQEPLTDHCCATCDGISFLYAGLQKHYPDDKRRVAILTPYKAQMRKLRSVFAASVTSVQMASVEFATVDGFQVRRVAIRGTSNAPLASLALSPAVPANRDTCRPSSG